MGPIWGRQDPGGPHVGHMNFAICVYNHPKKSSTNLWVTAGGFQIAQLILFSLLFKYKQKLCKHSLPISRVLLNCQQQSLNAIRMAHWPRLGHKWLSMLTLQDPDLVKKAITVSADALTLNSLNTFLKNNFQPYFIDWWLWHLKRN